MRSREDAQREVRVAVRRHMASRGWNKAELQEAAGIDPNTAGDFLNGRRWPQGRTLSKIERALEWPPGTIAAALEGAPLPETYEQAMWPHVEEPEGEPAADEGSFVAAPGERVRDGASDSEVMAAIREMTELVREMRQENRELRERLARAEGKTEG